MEELRQARESIDRIDAELARLFEARMAEAAKIAAWKQANHRPIRDPAREQELLARNTARIGDPALRPHFAAVLEALMAESRAYQAATQASVQTAQEAPCADRPGAPAPVMTLRTRTGSCPVFLRRGALSEAASLLPRGRRVFLVTDDEIPTDYVSALAGQCRDCVIWSIPAGEYAKSPEELTELLSAMLRAGLTRRDCVAALGGGVVGDLAGLAAALYMRGIDWYAFPTTLLAMVDASVGGKTAIDLDGVKNAVGAFWPPRAVVIDPDVLDTLEPRQLSNGLAEAVKMALTHDAALFARFEDPAGRGPIEDVIAACLRIKTAVVEADEREAGLRRVLNFGHTLGHGLEAAAEGRLLHGEAVALGMLPMCAPAVRARLLPVLERLGLPTYVNQNEVDPEIVMAAIRHDKKRIDRNIECVLVPEPGRFELQGLSLPELRARLDSLYRP